MPARRCTPAPPPIDVEAIRRKLVEGRIVRVGISRSAQFPDGGTGRVRSIGDPQTDGDEYVRVELSLNGTKDILPFTPADLTPATRGRPPGSGTKAAAPPAHHPRPPAAPEQPPAQSMPAQLVPSPATPPPTTPPQPMPTENSVPQRIGTAASPPADRVSPSPAPAEPNVDAPAEAKARTQRGARRPAAVSITVATTASEPTQWRIEARVGTKVAVKSAAASPARVWQLVQALDNEALSRAVGAILDEQRSAAQARADALAAELAAVQEELRALPESGR